MSTSGNLEALVERVLDRARQEATAMGERAEKAAEREVQQAEVKAHSRRESAEAVVREAAARRRHVMQAEVAQEERRFLLNTREQAVEDIFAEALKSFVTIDDPAVRRELLVSLVAEGIRALGTSAVRVRLNVAEQQLAQAPEFPSEIDGVPITIDAEPTEACGGPVVTDRDGRVVFENTFEARLGRVRERLRRQIADILQLRDGKGVQ